MVDKKTRHQRPTAVSAKTARAIKAAQESRAVGTDKTKKFSSDDPIKFDEPNFWLNPTRAMLDNFNLDNADEVSTFQDTVSMIHYGLLEDPVYAPGAEKILDDYDALLKIAAFVVGVTALTDDSVLTDADVRRVMAAINSAKWSLKHARNDRSARMLQTSINKMKRMNVRDRAAEAIEKDIDPYDLGDLSLPENIDTVTEMYRLMKMHRARSDGQRERTTANMRVLRRRLQSLVNTHHRHLAKKDKKAADKWMQEYIERQKFNTSRRKEAEGRDDAEDLDIFGNESDK